MDSQTAFHKFANGRMREIAELQAKAASDQTRRVQTALLTQFIREAIAKSPDTFQGWPDPMVLAVRLVDYVEGAA